MQTDNTSVSRRDLYPDFKLTHDNCASEPIHRPVAVQGHGHMLVLDRSHTIHALSESFAQSLGYETHSLWTTPIEKWLPPVILSALVSQGEADYLPECIDSQITLNGKKFDVIHYQCNGKFVIEFEPEADTDIADALIRRIAQRLRQISTAKELHALVTREIARAYDFDRVMIYQFDEDKHGHVVGEYKIDSLEPFLGLHYPETDIPKIARDLFLRVKFRAISDINQKNEMLIFNPSLGSNPPYLDLSQSQLRAISPIHIDYLSNMGVTATLTLAIIINGELWGLIACHHNSPKQVMFDHRLIGETLAELVAKRLFELDVAERKETEIRTRAIETFLLDQIKVSDNYKVEIIEQAASMIELCHADGAALITLNECVFSTGLVPSASQLLRICDWLTTHDHQEVFFTDHFVKDIDLEETWDVPIGGMLTSCISSISNSYILWFRQPATQIVNWAGDPNNSYSVEQKKGSDEIRLSPRESFAKWSIAVEDRSIRWERTALEMADRIRQGIFKKELLHTATLVNRSNREFLQLTFAAAHDLQEPLRTQTNYLDIMQESIQGEQNAELLHYISKTENAASRMKELVSDLLSYSQLGMESQREDFSLMELLSEVIDDMDATIKQSGARVHVDSLPAIRADRGKIKQLLQNLISNAIKYTASDVTPEVSIFLESQGSFSTINIKDNGIGIDEKYHSKIFVMFQRLHGKSEYRGTGIGLAICMKVADLMDARLGLQSVPGQGSTFWLKFHNSLLID